GLGRDGARSADWRRASARTAPASHGRSQQAELRAPAPHFQGCLARFRSICRARICPTSQTPGFSLVQPHVFEAPVVIDAVVMQDEALDRRLPASRRAIVGDDWSCQILRKLALNRPYKLLALLLIDFLRLPIDQSVNFLVAILGVVALRVAAVVLVKVHIRVVDANSREVEPYSVLLARHPGVPDAGGDHLRVARAVEILQLRVQDHGGVAIDGDVAGGYLHLKGVGLAVA